MQPPTDDRSLSFAWSNLPNCVKCVKSFAPQTKTVHKFGRVTQTACSSTQWQHRFSWLRGVCARPTGGLLRVCAFAIFKTMENDKNKHEVTSSLNNNLAYRKLYGSRPKNYRSERLWMSHLVESCGLSLEMPAPRCSHSLAARSKSDRIEMWVRRDAAW